MKFHKGIESGEYAIIPFTTLIFDYTLYLVFYGNTYYFSLTGYDLYEITDPDRQAVIHTLVRDIYKAKNIAHALELQIEFYLVHEKSKELTYFAPNGFEHLKSKSFMGSWALEQIKKLEGYGLVQLYRDLVVKLIDLKVAD